MPYSEVSSIFRSAEEPQVKQNKNEHTRQNMKSKRSTLGALCKETKNQYMKDCAIMCHYSICFLLGLPVVARVHVFFSAPQIFKICAIFAVADT